MNYGFPKKTFHAACTDLTYEGKGVCHDGNDVVFVDGMTLETGSFPLMEKPIPWKEKLNSPCRNRCLTFADS